MQITKYIPKTFILSGVALYATVAAACGAPSESRIEGTQSLQSILSSGTFYNNSHIIYFDPELKRGFGCILDDVKDYFSRRFEEDKIVVTFIQDGSKDYVNAAAIMVYPEGIGKDAESDIERIARDCEK